ncbi:hypothetical protein SLNWT_7055 [Streptomyces albus]|uniref:Uncharacterized protein n=1 Tax=Streptomyces albus (strain ATCC 21838 / DSM 41398 / FERM P-419 / JCM 4703 / NBRC 107858) TaxID=1081613 RepID=A0A0B5F9B9_STRA4|nr:hypothetical protein SLNWT_7055 [Streptomyces albus]AOU81734.1 hypothetical protein SLNHY_7043 [Streptomyces albus]AYN37424.1 hypothetical protein DUI70_6931 [Streptomyces albus]
MLTHLTTTAARAARTTRTGHGHEAEITRRRVRQLTHAAGTVGYALAHLGEAITQAGLLHHLLAQPRSTQRSNALATARDRFDRRIDSTRRHLHEAGRQLRHGADRLTAAATPAHSPPAATRSITSRTR